MAAFRTILLFPGRCLRNTGGLVVVGIPVACKVPRGWSELVLSGLEEGSEGAEGLRGMFTWLGFVSEAEEEGSEMSVMVCLWDRGR